MSSSVQVAAQRGVPATPGRPLRMPILRCALGRLLDFRTTRVPPLDGWPRGSPGTGAGRPQGGRNPAACTAERSRRHGASGLRMSSSRTHQSLRGLVHGSTHVLHRVWCASMTSVEEYVTWVLARLESDTQTREEPDLELKAMYASVSEAEDIWLIADLIAALANDAGVSGYRALVYGPADELVRPGWLPDEARIRDKFLRQFEGGVVPRVELLRRQLGNGKLVDLFVIVDRAETPYVTRSSVGGEWVVRVRTNTARRTATRAELLALSRGLGPTGAPVRRLAARLEPFGRGTMKIVVANVGTISVRNIELRLGEDSQIRRFASGDAIEELRPGEQDAFPILSPGRLSGKQRSERVAIAGVAEDGEEVTTDLLISPW